MKIRQSGSGDLSLCASKMADRSNEKDIHHSVLSNKLVVSEPESPTWKQHEREREKIKTKTTKNALNKEHLRGRSWGRS